jgi:hypothetical protein
MHPIVCPRCKVRVIPSPEGICPGCRKALKVPPSQVAPATVCPECGAGLAAEAVLCVACGFHLEEQRFLSTAVERQLPPDGSQFADPAGPLPLAPAETNPYASPTIPSDIPTRIIVAHDSEFVADLTPYAAKQAAAIVSDAGHVYWAIFLSLCICRIGWLVMFPWYGYRLYSWYRLNETFSELRNPTPRVSAHYSLALDFQAVKGRLWLGFIFGSIAAVLVLLTLVISIANQELR